MKDIAIVKASMLRVINEPGADPRWFKVIVPGHEPGQPMLIIKSTIPLYPPSLSASKHMELVSQERQDMVVVIDRSCIFAPDSWTKHNFQIWSPQPQGAACPCCGCQGKDDWIQKHPEIQMDALPAGAEQNQQQQQHKEAAEVDEALPAGFIAAAAADDAAMLDQQQQQQQKAADDVSTTSGISGWNNLGTSSQSEKCSQ